MTRARAVVGWLANWRNGATVVASVLVALVGFVVIDASIARNGALDARNRTASAATRRIDLLNERIEELGEDLVASANANGVRIGELSAQIAALQEQVRQLGGEPVVVRPTTTTTAGASPPPSTTTTTRPPTTTTTTAPPNDGGICIGSLCIGA